MNLLQGPKRFNALRASMGHISSKTLSHRLKVMEEHLLLGRGLG